MKILIANEQDFAMKYIREGYGKALDIAGHDVTLWDIRTKSVFDAFDLFNPDLVFLQGYNLNDSVMKCIEERPNLKIVMRVSDWSDFNDSIKNEYPVISASNFEIESLKKIQSLPNPLLLHTHHCEEYLDKTHGRWVDNGFDLYAFENFADIIDYTNGIAQESLKCDLTFIGGYWGYKSKNLNKYIIPLCQSNNKYTIKIFGNQPWPTPKYCGFLQPGLEKNMLKSAQICLNIHEPHSTDFGYDIITRPYNLMANKSFMISDHVEGLVNRFSCITAKTPEEYFETIDYYINNPQNKEDIVETCYEQVIEKHTAFDRLVDIFDRLHISNKDIQAGKKKVIEAYNL